MQIGNYKMLFLCPKCGEQLTEASDRAVCKNNHSYDRAREGYYHLLLGSSSFHGDNKEMVNARRTFLSRGFYEPLAAKVASSVTSRLREGDRILDFGCGEGYYTDIVERGASDKFSSSVFGFDISKDAVRAAAKKNKRISYFVASSYRLPLPDFSFDVGINIFSPLALDEIRRVIRPNGSFIMVIPDVMHLYELKEKIYDVPYKNTVEDTELSGFTLISDEQLHYDMHLGDNESITALFKMTPYAYRTRSSDAEKIIGLQSLTVRANFRILVYERCGE